MAKKTKSRKQPKQRKKKPGKSKSSIMKGSIEKSLRKSLNGFWMTWSSQDPLEDYGKPTAVRLGHQNPVMNLRLTNDNFYHLFLKVLDEKPLKWRLEIRMEFTKKNGDPEFKRYEIVGVDRLKHLEEKYLDTVETMLADAVEKNYLDRYVTTHVLQETLSGQTIKDSDFSPN